MFEIFGLVAVVFVFLLVAFFCFWLVRWGRKGKAGIKAEAK
jgi:hypothetical protein